jgi:D-alanine-D-alanine ligase
MKKAKLDILVLAGGESSEREVSLNSSKAVAQALAQFGNRVRIMDASDGRWLTENTGNPGSGKSGVEAIESDQTAGSDLPGINLTRALLKAREEGVDVVFLGLHGGFGENGSIQALLDILGIPYTGSPMAASAIAMNKDISKRVMRTLGISTADWQTFDRSAGAYAENAEIILKKGIFGWPVIIKPVDSGSTVGLTLVEREDQLGEAIAIAFRESDAIMAERYLSGREITIAVLDGQALPPVEIKPTHKLYDYTCKYTKGKSH